MPTGTLLETGTNSFPLARHWTEAVNYSLGVELNATQFESYAPWWLRGSVYNDPYMLTKAAKQVTERYASGLAAWRLWAGDELGLRGKDKPNAFESFLREITREELEVRPLHDRVSYRPLQWIVTAQEAPSETVRDVIIPTFRRLGYSLAKYLPIYKTHEVTGGLCANATLIKDLSQALFPG